MAGEASFTATEDDYVGANRAWLKRTIFSRRTAVRASLLVGLFIVLGILSAPLDSSLAESAKNVLFFAILGLLVAPFCYWLIFLLQPRRVRKLYRQQKSFGHPFHYSWSDEGLDFSSMHGSAKFAWADFHKWSDNDRFFLFLLNDQLFYFLPFRALTDSQIADLRATALHRVQPLT